MQGRDESGQSGWRFMGVGMELGGAVLVMALIGWAIDRQWETGPWGVVICSTIGVAGGLYNLVKRVIRESGTDGRSDKR